jgi:hypothetical protein
LHPYDVDPGNYELWDKVGQGVGNLKSLSVLKIIPTTTLAMEKMNPHVIGRY